MTDDIGNIVEVETVIGRISVGDSNQQHQHERSQADVDSLFLVHLDYAAARQSQFARGRRLDVNARRQISKGGPAVTHITLAA